ncbi:RNA polymerase sigma factor SigX [Aurantivibrio infirmus]
MNCGNFKPLQNLANLQKYREALPINNKHGSASSDEELVALAKLELPYVTTSYEQLVRRHEKLIRHVCYGIVKDKSLADDISQEVMLNVFRKLYSFENRSSFKTWLMTISVNTSISYCRKRERDELFIEYSSQTNPKNNGNSESRSEQSNLESSTDPFEQLVSQLDEKERQIVTLKFVAELEFNEIAESLELGTSAVKMRYYRALKKLKINLKNQE